MSGANLYYAYLNRANLSGADLSYAALSGATWNDGRFCAAGSVGTCNLAWLTRGRPPVRYWICNRHA